MSRNTLMLLVLGMLLSATLAVVRATDTVHILSVATLADIPLADAQAQSAHAQTLTNDRGILLGGVGSDIFHMPGEPNTTFWAITDRGPNSEVSVGDETRATALVPDFTPMIVQFRVADGIATPIRSLAITTTHGAPVTGLPNRRSADPQFWDATGATPIAYNPNGLDTEGLVRTRSGEFWVVDEYGPSIVHISAKGSVLARYVPSGINIAGADYPVHDTLPAAYAARKANRGFEGVAISADERTLFVVLQSPLSAPNKEVGDRTRSTRIIKFDIPTTRVTGEYAYRLEIAGVFNPRAKMKQSEMKLSGVAAVDADTLLVLERTDWAFAIYKVELEAATNIVGSVWSTTNTPVSLEYFSQPQDVNVIPARKSLVVQSGVTSDIPEKIEGLAILDDTTLMIANDNDFDVGSIDAAGNNVGMGKKTRFITLVVPSLK